MCFLNMCETRKFIFETEGVQFTYMHECNLFVLDIVHMVIEITNSIFKIILRYKFVHSETNKQIIRLIWVIWLQSNHLETKPIETFYGF